MSSVGDCCVFILSYDRPERVKTLQTLENHGYTGDWYIIVDHESDYERYCDEHGEDNVVFLDKDDALPELDRGDNFDNRNCNVYARYQTFDLAQELGYDYFLLLDDDYEYFEVRFNENYEFGYDKIKNNKFNDLDRYIDLAIEYMERADLDCFAMAQGGDFIGGKHNQFAQAVQTSRKIMNTFLCQADKPFEFRGTINEDVNTYVRAAQLGKLFLTTNALSVDQEDTQQDDGGLTEIYLDEGTYIKSFYTILFAPSCTTLGDIHDRQDPRIHHRVSWRNAVPKIVPESTTN